MVRPSDGCCYGTVAYLISRRAMETMISSYTVQSVGRERRLECPTQDNWKGPRISPVLKCISDWMIPGLLEVLYATPPLFAVRVMEGTTGVREDDIEEKRNDHEKGHVQSFLQALQWNIEASEMARSGKNSTESLPQYQWKVGPLLGKSRRVEEMAAMVPVAAVVMFTASVNQ